MNCRKPSTNSNDRRIRFLSGLFLIHFLLLFQGFVLSQDSIPGKKERPWSLNGYVKDMQTLIIQRLDERIIAYNLVHNRFDFKWNISNSFTFGLGERNRFYWGDLDALGPQYDEFIAYDGGLVNMSWNIFWGPSYVLNASIDRAWLDYTRKNFQVTIGRQRINWSETYVWNPNDIFNTYSYFDFDYEEKPGSDAVRLQYFTGPSSRAEMAVKADKDKKVTAAGLYRFNTAGYDFQGMAGVYRQDDFVAGVGWAGQIAKGGFKGEVTWFQPLNHFFDTAGVFLSSVEYDYTFRNSIFIQFEGFYNSNKSNPTNVLINQFNPSLLNSKNPFLNGWSIFGNISYPPTPLITLSLAGIYNPSNQVYFILPSFTISILNNLDLSILAQSYQFYSSSARNQSQTLLFGRVKWAF
jgi:hypothetical protein